ncbi:hypothetical protein [Candidatus Chloroploca asiatica]|uniref:Uncharacterized protein n=1 Tax=Candidatus Chloroploca asiatica TaxID=1506545 RepID=A0A2H3KS09_9CHLR|nr:hypothetical protein [Candidatus Chloroploca asiatica]PDW00401.1 hypothetical protein A9Q02_21760 [Candidatus Chloroploca asiatica]
MQPSFLDALGLFQWLGFAVLVAAWPVYELLTPRRRARQAEERAAQPLCARLPLDTMLPKTRCMQGGTRGSL